MIDDVEKSVAEVAELDAASVSFFRDLPSTFLLIRAQLNQVHISKLLLLWLTKY